MAAAWLLAPALLACAPGGEVPNKPTADGVRADLTAHLPLGSSPEQVAAFVNQRGYTSDGPVDPANLSPRVARPGEFELPAIIRGTGRLGLVSYSIQMRFLFDDARKLTGIEVKDIGTGP